MRFEERVILHEFQFTEKEDLIINYIKNHKSLIPSYSIKKLSDIVGVVPTTIMRLCQKLGYSGYAELKNDLNSEKTAHYFTKKFPTSLTHTVEMIDKNILEGVAEKIKKCGTCYWLGVGESRYFCEMMASNLMCMGKQSISIDQYHEMERKIRNCHTLDLIVFISASGQNERLVKYAEMAKSRGIKIISVTHCSKNPLAKVADTRLYFWGEKRVVNGYNVTDRLGMNYLLRQLSEVFWRIYWL